eukprot:s1829_g4.t1
MTNRTRRRRSRGRAGGRGRGTGRAGGGAKIHDEDEDKDEDEDEDGDDDDDDDEDDEDDDGDDDDDDTDVDRDDHDEEGCSFDLQDRRYADGKPAILRHTDGSGFAYYASGKKAICVSAAGVDGVGRSRRFSAIIHDDGGRTKLNAVVGVFDDWGIGYADGMLGQGDTQAPKLLISEKAITVVDGNGKVSEVPTSPKAAGTTDLVLRINQHITLRHKKRTFLDFQCENVNHTFVIGEMHGEEVRGMTLASEEKSLSEQSTQQLQEATLKLDGVCELAKTLQAP